MKHKSKQKDFFLSAFCMRPFQEQQMHSVPERDEGGRLLLYSAEHAFNASMVVQIFEDKICRLVALK